MLNPQLVAEKHSYFGDHESEDIWTIFEKEGVAWNCWLTFTIPIYLPLKDYKQYISTMT